MYLTNASISAPFRRIELFAALSGLFFAHNSLKSIVSTTGTGSKVMLDDLLKRARISAESRLLDLATGPGRIAIPLASSFREVWTVDLEPEMIEVGRKEAANRGINNIRSGSKPWQRIVAD